MSNKHPSKVTDVEIEELAKLSDLRGLWNAQTAADMRDILDTCYLSKTYFDGGTYGYRGELYLVQPGYLAYAVPVIRVIRNKRGRLEVLNYLHTPWRRNGTSRGASQ